MKIVKPPECALVVKVSAEEWQRLKEYFVPRFEFPTEKEGTVIYGLLQGSWIMFILTPTKEG